LTRNCCGKSSHPQIIAHLLIQPAVPALVFPLLLSNLITPTQPAVCLRIASSVIVTGGQTKQPAFFQLLLTFPLESCVLVTNLTDFSPSARSCMIQAGNLINASRGRNIKLHGISSKCNRIVCRNCRKVIEAPSFSVLFFNFAEKTFSRSSL
jgi:hypothetical protein